MKFAFLFFKVVSGMESFQFEKQLNKYERNNILT